MLLAAVAGASSWLVRPTTPGDLDAVSNLHAKVFGPGRFARTAYRVREGAGSISRFCRVAIGDDGRIIGAVTFTEISIGGRDGALLLGPVVVLPGGERRGLGALLISTGVNAAARDGVRLVVLVGDQPYYGRFGFLPVASGRIAFPGPVDPARILALELEAGALKDYAGAIAASPQLTTDR